MGHGPPRAPMQPTNNYHNPPPQHSFGQPAPPQMAAPPQMPTPPMQTGVQAPPQYQQE